MKTVIRRWFARCAGALTVSALLACGTSSPVLRPTMSTADARKLAREMGSYARAGNVQSREGVGITAVYITLSTMKLRLNDAMVVVVPLKELTLRVACHGYCLILLEDKTDLIVSNPDALSLLIDALGKLRQSALSGGSLEDDEHFAEYVRVYRSAATKPSLTEEVRRFSVQAADAIRDKDFDAAADLYERALDIAPWWPEGHFNRALVLSESGDFQDAIAEMKRYLALVPEASDARTAQDKIYVWERKASQ